MKSPLIAGLLALGLTLQGCGLDEVKVPDTLVGPSELGISLEMLALPDIVVADGIQTSIIRVVVRDQNGKPLAGKPIVFSIADEVTTGGALVRSTVVGVDGDSGQVLRDWELLERLNGLAEGRGFRRATTSPAAADREAVDSAVGSARTVLEREVLSLQLSYSLPAISLIAALWPYSEPSPA